MEIGPSFIDLTSSKTGLSCIPLKLLSSVSNHFAAVYTLGKAINCLEETTWGFLVKMWSGVLALGQESERVKM